MSATAAAPSSESRISGAVVLRYAMVTLARVCAVGLVVGFMLYVPNAVHHAKPAGATYGSAR